MKLKFTAYLVI